MRLIVWNCNMAMHKKLEVLLALQPDIAVLAECAGPDVKAMTPVYAAASSHEWVGTKRHKGLAVLTFGEWGITELAKPASGQFAIPLHVHGPTPFRLLALWTQRPGYVEQAHKALDGLEPFLRGEGPPDASHSAFVARLDRLGLFSAYHAHHEERHGEESRATFYLYRHAERGFHLDYVFLPEAWRDGVRSVDVGEHGAWREWSDHVAVVIGVEVPSSGGPPVEETRPDQAQCKLKV